MAIKSIHDWFSKKKKDKEIEGRGEKLDIPGDLWVKCYRCNATIYTKDLIANHKVCTKCGYHFKLSFRERLELLLDSETFGEIDARMRSKDFLSFVDSVPYSKRIDKTMEKSGLTEAIVTGTGKIGELPVCIGVMDFSFMGGSMGSVVGEKVTRLIEKAIEFSCPLILVSSSGGARMQEGIMSLMQMAKTSGALAKLRESGLPYISVLTDPTTGGTTASYAMLGDIHIAEPGALIGFAGPRVIEQTIKQKLPEGFQRSEYLLEHGMVDIVVPRNKLKETIIKILSILKA
ncbi:MAG: acetyl-CoA carboxylase, carboxyltransferase subunit beta [Candidatus Saganbacteria bacterium]|nr:acetyl-CoA carboxylase, carboxyltransferase subunit beta [Candidatus Saganbacteria bacterium]